MTPPILARVAQLHGSSEEIECNTISTTTSWEYVSKSCSLSDLTRFDTTFLPTSNSQNVQNSSATQQIYGRPLLPHGIVPLPPPHRVSQNNGHSYYRLSQKDLLHPQSDNPPAVPLRTPSSSRTTTKEDSNPVMRSASFNCEYAAVRKPKFRAQKSSQDLQPLPNHHFKVQVQVQQRAQAKDSVENGSGDVYNVPYQSEIYSLPVDSIKSANPNSSNNSVSQVNQNQRFKTGADGPNNTPNVSKNQLDRRKSQEDNRGSQSTQIKDSSQPDERTTCRPPQRWSSLSTQPSHITVAKPVPILGSSHQTTAVNIASSTKPIIKPFDCKPILKQQLSLNSSFGDNPATKNGFTPTPEPVIIDRSISNVNSSSSRLNSSDFSKTANTNGVSSKKPRSRSVDPPAGIDQTHNGHGHTAKRALGSLLSSTEISIKIDIPNPSTNAMSGGPGDHHGSSLAGKESVDRKNPLGGLNFLNLFRRNKTGNGTSKHNPVKTECPDDFTNRISEENFTSSNNNATSIINNNNKEDTSYYFRELPPPPAGHSESGSDEQSSPSPMECRDFAASIERVKDCGWYWGPLSSEAAEDLLRNEPDGSFIVRDSSDARYIFSLTFKLHGLVRHVRIEHDQGNFSFGPLTRFKAATIVDFVEKAVAHSRSGRYLFFLHRRPVLGPMQVQLLHPYSRFMHPRSLKHMCRFVILKYVRRDLIHTLPLPKPLQDYLNTPHYYFEPPESSSKNSSSHCNNTTTTVA